MSKKAIFSVVCFVRILEHLLIFARFKTRAVKLGRPLTFARVRPRWLGIVSVLLHCDYPRLARGESLLGL